MTLFAMRNYKEAAATLYAVLSVGPGWDWTTMIDLYPSEQVYESQLRALEAYVGQNPDAPDGHFVLAYQYMTAAHPEEAAQQYQDVLHLVPTDSVSRQMLGVEQHRRPARPGPSGDGSAGERGGPGGQPAEMLGRSTTPSPADGNVDLSLGNDGRFVWKFSQAGNAQTFAGKFELAGNTLVLDYDNGGTMVAKVGSPGPERFTFQMVGGPPNDPELPSRGHGDTATNRHENVRFH